MGLRNYQLELVKDAVSFLTAAKPGDRRVYQLPTGTGKSYCELAIQDAVPGSWIVSPRIEILVGMLEKRGVKVDSQDSAIAECDKHHLSTPLRLRNRLLKGEDLGIKALIHDEAHHHTSDTYELLDLLLGVAPSVGLTATAFRGTPAGTARFRESWGEPKVFLTLREASDSGFITFPECRIEPLLDDDTVEVKNGEFLVSSLAKSVGSRLGDVGAMCRAYYDGIWDKPTIFAMPETETAQILTNMLNAVGLSAVYVDAKTPYTARQKAFADVIARKAALVQVAVVAEGVDQPFRRLIDLAPTLSPVLFLQRFGRITRPGGGSEYVCCNRNLLRHAYLLQGCLPHEVLCKATAAFPPGKRVGVRALGLEAIGRFKGAPLPLASGLTGTIYAMSAVEGASVTEYVAILHPARADVLWVKRVSGKRPNGMRDFGRWEKTDPPEGLQGFKSLAPSEPSPKQAAWWARSHMRHGLGAGPMNRKNFVALPILSDLGGKL